MHDDLIKSIKEKRLISCIYDDSFRILQPHTYGLDKYGKGAIRVYQITGTSQSGSNWKLFLISKIEELKILDTTVMYPKFGYKKRDSNFKVIFAEL
jgi:hypothetical protein